MPIQIQSSLFTWILLSLLLVLGAVMIWKELNKSEDKWLYFRLIAVVISVISLAVILLRPSVTIAKKSQNALLVTHYSDSLAIEKWIQENPTSSIIYLNSYDAYLSEKELNVFNIDTLYWSGIGPSFKERILLKSLSVKWLHNSLLLPPNYIDSISYDQELSLSDSFNITAIVYSQFSNQTIVYEGFTGVVDSIQLVNGFNKIRFGEQPKTSGNFTAKLSLKNNNKTLMDEMPIPIIVKNPKPFSVLMLSSYPQFENRYLKEWLVNQGYEVIYRTAISKDKFRDEYFNTSVRSMALNNTDFYKRFDFILADAFWLNQASKNEIEPLKSSLQTNNQALIVFPDARAKQLKMINNTLVFENANSVKPISYTHETGQKNELAPSTVQLKAGKPILESAVDFGNLIHQGRSKIGVLHFIDSYQWLLQGNGDHYATLWSEIFNKLGQQQKMVEWKLKTNWPVTDESVQIDLITSERLDSLSIVGNQQTQLDIIQDLHLSELFHINFNAKKQGWYCAKLNSDTSHQFHFYVSKPSGMAAFLLKGRLEDNLYYFNNQMSREYSKTTTSTNQKVALWPFFILFLFSMGFLWLEPRI